MQRLWIFCFALRVQKNVIRAETERSIIQLSLKKINPQKLICTANTAQQRYYFFPCVEVSISLLLLSHEMIKSHLLNSQKTGLWILESPDSAGSGVLALLFNVSAVTFIATNNTYSGLWMADVVIQSKWFINPCLQFENYAGYVTYAAGCLW